MVRCRYAVLLSAVVAACGGSVAVVGGNGGGPDPTGGSSGTSGGSSGTLPKKDGGTSKLDSSSTDDAAREANAPGCPSSYMEPPGNCTLGLVCAYDQGKCECLGYCGGAPPPPDTDFSHWTCTPKLVNGCPDSPPVSGSLCKTPAASCTYGSCCVETFICGQSGKWSSGGLACPP